MLTSIFHAGSFALPDVALALAAALVMGVGVAALYRLVAPEDGGAFPMVLAVMPLLVTAVIMIVNGNLGVSVAVLGAFGLVRFRSAPGTATEIGFLFYAMAIGLAAGMGFLTMAVLIAAVVGAVLFLLSRSDLARGASRERQLRITIPEDLNYNGLFDDLFQAYTRRCRLERVKTTNMGTMFELRYRLVMRSDEKEKELIDAIRCRNGNLTVILGLVQPEKNVL